MDELYRIFMLLAMPQNTDAQAMAVALGQAVRVRRERLGIAQEKFAFQCDLDRTYIGGIERGLRNPTLASVRKIARGLGVSMVALVRDVERILDRGEVPRPASGRQRLGAKKKKGK